MGSGCQVWCYGVSMAAKSTVWLLVLFLYVYIKLIIYNALCESHSLVIFKTIQLIFYFSYIFTNNSLFCSKIYAPRTTPEF